jgi:hypothetical protein
MKTYIDNQLLYLSHELFGDSYYKTGILVDNDQVELAFGWPTLLEYLGLGSLFETFPQFNDQHPLFDFLIASIATKSDKDLIIRIYDQIFVECLTQVKALSEIDPASLLSQIRNKRQSTSFLSLPLEGYERLLLENPYNTIHDLTLYLAWDRVCVNLAVVFDYIYPEIKSPQALQILKDCLLESFQHISAQGRTAPVFFRLIEALFAYQMRDENIQSHTESEWQILCQSSKALRAREHLSDIYYVDAAIINTQQIASLNNSEKIFRVCTMDSADRVNSSMSLANLMIDKLKNEESKWQYALRPVEIICLKRDENGLSVDAVLNF